jgi:membrane protein implicated in regulation of membrane protease activity
LIGLFGLDVPSWTHWLVFSVLAVAAMLAFRRRLYDMVRNRSGHVDERLTVGDRVVVASRLEPGQSGRVEYRGSSWTARNTGDGPIEAGREAVIAEVSGLTLHVKAE